MKLLSQYKLFLVLMILSVAVLTAFRLKEKNNYNIVYIGDSITESRMVADAANFGPAAIATDYLKALGRYQQIRFSNQGHSGFTTVDFLPEKHKAFPGLIGAADRFADDHHTTIVFSIMLGTNDSAEKGPNGSPVSAEAYRANLKTLTDTLLNRYPNARVVLNAPIYYSDSTQNRSVYLRSGRARLQTYFPQIRSLVKAYKHVQPGRVYLGDENAYSYFKKNYLSDMNEEHGPAGTFYLHPNKKGAQVLGTYWGKALGRILG